MFLAKGGSQDTLSPSLFYSIWHRDFDKKQHVNKDGIRCCGGKVSNVFKQTSKSKFVSQCAWPIDSLNNDTRFHLKTSYSSTYLLWGRAEFHLWLIIDHWLFVLPFRSERDASVLGKSCWYPLGKWNVGGWTVTTFRNHFAQALQVCFLITVILGSKKKRSPRQQHAWG